MQIRRVGSVTFGLSLIIMGVLFMIGQFIPEVGIKCIMMAWPVIFIIMGIELLVEYWKEREGKIIIKYDFPAIFMLVFLIIFAVGMAGVDFLMINKMAIF